MRKGVQKGGNLQVKQTNKKEDVREAPATPYKQHCFAIYFLSPACATRSVDTARGTTRGAEQQPESHRVSPRRQPGPAARPAPRLPNSTAAGQPREEPRPRQAGSQTSWAVETGAPARPAPPPGRGLRPDHGGAAPPSGGRPLADAPRGVPDGSPPPPPGRERPLTVPPPPQDPHGSPPE